jgi:septal ring factor EnvC (AmiA/AmiB activator)
MRLLKTTAFNLTILFVQVLLHSSIVLSETEPPILLVTNEIQKLSEKSKEIRSRINDLRTREEQQRSEISKIETEIYTLIEREEKLANELDEIAVQKQLLKEEVKQLYSEEKKLIQLKSKRLIAIESLPKADLFIKVITVNLFSKDYFDVEDQIVMLSSRIQDRDNNLVKDLISVRSQLTSQTEVLAKLFSKQRSLHDQLRQERQQMATLLEKKKELQSAILQQKKNREGQALKLTAEMLRLESIKQELFETSRYQPSNSKTDETAMNIGESSRIVTAEHFKSPLFKNRSLTWPINGTVFKKFAEGPEEEGLRHGILIKSHSKQPGEIEVKSVEQGIVGFIGHIPFYGLSVIISHGPGEFSLYGNLKILVVEVGSAVKRGEQIGLAGQMDGVNMVYLELRRGDKSIDPATLMLAKAS